MQTNHRQTIETISLFTFALLLFTFGLRSEEIIGFDSRFYLFAQEMWRYGISWFPTTYHEPYPDYPGTSTILIYLMAYIGGGINKLTAVLPSAIASSLTLVFTYRIGALHERRWGLYAVFFMLLTITFLKSSRSIALDMYTTLFTTCCFYLIYSADLEQKTTRAKWIYLFLFLGFIFRGPIGLVIPTGVVCSYYLLSGQMKRVLQIGFRALFLLVMCSALLLMLAYHVGGHTLMQDVLRMEVLGRMDSSYLPRYFYFVDGMANYALSFPIAIVVMIGVCYCLFTREKSTPEMKLLWKCIGWMMIILIGMSIPGDKKIRYILPMLPACALLAAYPFVASSKETYFIYLRKGLFRFFLFFPLILFALSVAAFIYVNQHKLDVTIPFISIAIFLSVMQVINFFITYYSAHKEISVLFIAVLSIVITNISVMERIELTLDKARDFVMQVEAKRNEDHARLVFYREKPDSMPIKYLINMTHEEKPLFVDHQQGLVESIGPAYFVASESYFDELSKTMAIQFRVIAKNSIGHVPVVVFTWKR